MTFIGISVELDSVFIRKMNYFKTINHSNNLDEIQVSLGRIQCNCLDSFMHSFNQSDIFDNYLLKVQSISMSMSSSFLSTGDPGEKELQVFYFMEIA